MERRKHARLPLRLKAYLYRHAGEDPLEAATINVSIGGFACFTRDLFNVNERMFCVIVVHEKPGTTANVLLQCEVQVLRVVQSGTSDGSPHFSVAFQICTYHVVSDPASDAGIRVLPDAARYIPAAYD